MNIPDQDSMYLGWANNFATVAAANATALGLTSGQTTTLTTLATAFESAYNASEIGKNNAHSLIATKDDMRTASEAAIRGIGKVINADPNISDALKAELGFSVTPSVAGPVSPPVDLVVNGYETGVNSLVWDRNGNIKGTVFLIEYKPTSSSPWLTITSVTGTKYEHINQVPGMRMSYRVSAKRGSVQSVACAPAVVYDDVPVAPVLTLHEAA